MPNPYEPIAQRMVNAENKFARLIVDSAAEPCTLDEAHAVTALYLKNKIARMDAVMGRITVTHGAYLEPDVISNALEMVRD